MPESPRISIVDDDASVLRALSRLCRSAGYLVDTFGSAEEFLEAVAINKPQCLVLDVHLPGRSGLDLQNELHAAGIQFPVIIVTAAEGDHVETQSLRNGAAAFLRKPVDSERLLKVIQEALGA